MSSNPIIAKYLYIKEMIQKNIKNRYLYIKEKRITLLLLFFTLIVFTQDGLSQEYQPPIGIPVPYFGINESVESIYGSNNYYTHYIDNTNPHATDENNPNGSSTKPRMSIPEEMILPEGSVVLIKGGPYNLGFNSRWIGNGTKEKPVFIRGENSTSIPQLLNAHVKLDGQYLIIENLEFYDDSYLHTLETSNHLTIRNCEIHNPIGKIIDFGAAILAQGSDIVIYKNHIHHNVTNDPKKGGDCHGVNPGVSAKRVWILENEINNNSGDAIQACHSCDPHPQFIYIGMNILHEDRENAVDLKYASDIIISQNKMYGYKNATTSDGSVVVLGSDGMPNRSWVIFNEIYDSRNGIRNEDTDSAWIIGNVIYNIDGFAISLEKKSEDLYIINNTIYNVDVAIDQLRVDKETFRIHVFNNIFANIKGNNHASQLNVPSNKIAGVSELNNNLFWQKDAPVFIKWGSEFIMKSTSDFNEFLGGVNNLIENPYFEDVSRNNFNLLPNSAAINKGVSHTTYNKFFELYGIDIKFDFSGTKRPDTLNWDIGAFEFIK
ncbi:MAG: right-handed parallel beta-helix repeat-containing protein [Melioribacteraceae bacterium]|nr:right-handed parallel beta-helix repeat-containing protein [Melioribacteraceae bacterium]